MKSKIFTWIFPSLYPPLMELTLNNKRTVQAWWMYDWANSVYNLVITTTFFPIYFLGVTKAAYGENNVPFLGRTFKNSALYDYTLAVAYLTMAVLLPILSSIADSEGNKKKVYAVLLLLRRNCLHGTLLV